MGAPYNFTVNASGSPAPTFGETGLLDGLSLDATTGEITGTPTTATYRITITTPVVVNAVPTTSAWSLIITVLRLGVLSAQRLLRRGD